MSRSLDILELRGLSIDSVIGAYPSERGAGQRLFLDVDLHLDTRGAAAGIIAKTVDYARLIGELRFLMHACRFALLESAAEAMCRYILAPPTPDMQRAQVQRVSVWLRKPNASAALRVTRKTSEYNYPHEDKDFGQVDIVYEGPGAGIYRLRIAPGHGIATHAHFEMDECELVMGPMLHLQGQAVAAGSMIEWPRDFAHRYDNQSDTEQTVLCVDRPRFLPQDEVPTPAARLQMPPIINVYPSEHAAPY